MFYVYYIKRAQTSHVPGMARRGCQGFGDLARTWQAAQLRSSTMRSHDGRRAAATGVAIGGAAGTEDGSLGESEAGQGERESWAAWEAGRRGGAGRPELDRGPVTGDANIVSPCAAEPKTPSETRPRTRCGAPGRGGGWGTGCAEGAPVPRKEAAPLAAFLGPRGWRREAQTHGHAESSGCSGPAPRCTRAAVISIIVQILLLIHFIFMLINI